MSFRLQLWRDPNLLINQSRKKLLPNLVWCLQDYFTGFRVLIDLYIGQLISPILIYYRIALIIITFTHSIFMRFFIDNIQWTVIIVFCILLFLISRIVITACSLFYKRALLLRICIKLFQRRDIRKSGYLGLSDTAPAKIFIKALRSCIFTGLLF